MFAVGGVGPIWLSRWECLLAIYHADTICSRKIQSIYILAARIFRSMRMMAGITVSNVRCLRKTINSIIYSINGCGFWRKEVSASRPHNSDTWHGSIFDRFVSIISNLSEFLSAFGGLLY